MASAGHKWYEWRLADKWGYIAQQKLKYFAYIHLKTELYLFSISLVSQNYYMKENVCLICFEDDVSDLLKYKILITTSAFTLC